ncbi:MAG: TIGR04211 family SH3 domain-containing protein [Gammaproteobacteria bacterium]
MKKGLVLRPRWPLFALLLLSAKAGAQTAYVNDQLEITLRSGESTQHSIVRMLTSGARVEVVSRNPESGYAQVRLEDGRTGYVLARFLSDIPAARDRLVNAEQRLATLTAQKATVDQQLATLREAKRDGDKTSADLNTRNQALNDELAQIKRTAADALNLDARNKDLSSKLDVSETTISELRAQNTELEAGSAQRWFMLGAGAVLFGALLGFLLPRIRWPRRSRWGDL